ncbi:hypothetical protein SmJEL517_g01767 [Synchytrium microbalum]|uniref:Uncharacterized protein n=1 Tax=Synchytrium microbalum TaxID=1806994 RepID=A0A507CD12_9FUNG|nr:uncharacterized protein SmJEL517_g01767 [Synchytrium microbalum]TPX35936.1 hypothetical protein SmJEL517_g01767 [Synchytrium microbalum]
MSATALNLQLRPVVTDESWKLVTRLLEENHKRFEIVYHGYFASHVAHDLLSLYKLKAPISRIQQCYDYHASYLETPKPSINYINAQNWSHHLGQEKYKQDYRDFFDSEIERLGFSQTVYTYLPRLIPSLISEAFHPFIHMGFALEFEHPLLLSEALAFWCFGSNPISPINTRSHDGNKSLVEVVGMAMNDSELKSNAKHNDKFDDRAHNAASGNGASIINKYVDMWSLGETITTASIADKVKEIRTAAMYAFTSFGSRDDKPPPKLDFFMAHGVTASHALSCIVKYLNGRTEDQVAILRYFVQGLIIACWAQGGWPVSSKVVESYPIGEGGDVWSEVMAKGIASKDDHIPKLVCAFKQDELKYGYSNGVYMKAAKLTVDTFGGKDEHWEYDGAGFKLQSRI